MKLAAIAQLVGGRLEGDGAIEITGVAGLREAGRGDVSFLTNARYASAVAGTGASAVLLGEEWRGACPCALVRVADPNRAFALLAERFAPPLPEIEAGIHATAVLGRDVALGKGVSVGPHVTLGRGVRVGDRTAIAAGCVVGQDTTIGADCRLHSLVSVREHTRIGNRVIVHSGSVIGSDGFGYTPVGGRWEKIEQRGIVEIGDDVEIGANVTVDRARFGRTVIERGVKIDNLVQVAHNVRIGADTAIAAQVGIAGSTHVGAHTQIGGQAGVGGHLRVGAGAVIGGQAGVTKDVAPRTFVSGYPAMPHAKARRLHALTMRLPELRRRLGELEERLRELVARTQAREGGT